MARKASQAGYSISKILGEDPAFTVGANKVTDKDKHCEITLMLYIPEIDVPSAFSNLSFIVSLELLPFDLIAV